jgi:hypothetical protein
MTNWLKAGKGVARRRARGERAVTKSTRTNLRTSWTSRFRKTMNVVLMACLWWRRALELFGTLRRKQHDAALTREDVEPAP